MPYDSIELLSEELRAILPFPAQRLFRKVYNDTYRGDDAEAREAAFEAIERRGYERDDCGRYVQKRDFRSIRDAAAAAMQMLRLATVLKYNPHQPRAKDGKWTGGMSGGGGWGTPIPAHLGGGKAAWKYKEDPQQAAFTKPLTDAELTGLEPHLGNPHGYVLKDPRPTTNVMFNDNPEDVATYAAGKDPGRGLNGIPFTHWQEPKDWSKVEGQGKFEEPDLPDTGKKRLGAGVIIEEPDGRIWTINPLNSFGGYSETFPKGGIEEGLNLRQTAIKEAFEESGLKVELTGYVGDFERNTSVARYYRARRTGGSPTDYHWETESVNAVPFTALEDYVTHPNDKAILSALKGEGAVVQKAWLSWADLVERLGALFDKAKKGGAWQKQMRVPAGLPTGGRWTTYGSGGWGSAFAQGGKPLELQKYNGTGADAKKLNYNLADLEKSINETGTLTPWAQKQAAKTKEPAGFKGAAGWNSVKEAEAYLKVKAIGPKPSEPSKKAGKPKAGTHSDPLLLSDMKKVGPKPGGSSQGAIYEDADGVKWLVKSYKSGAMVTNEVLASRMYNMAGVSTPEMKLVDLGGQYNGGKGVASRYMDNLEPMSVQNPAHLKAVQKDFAAHAYMANWDAVGLSFDNIMINKDTGLAVMVDPGGALNYRAQGSLKGDAFGVSVGEIDSLRDPKINPTAAATFGTMTQTQIVESMNKLLDNMDNVEPIPGHMASAIMGSPVPVLSGKMEARLKDVKKRRDALEAEVATTTSLDISSTGTTTGKLSHSDPQIQQAVMGTDHQIKSVIADSIKAIDDAKGEISDANKSFYTPLIDSMESKALSGDVKGLGESFYEPLSSKAKMTPSYSAYLKAHASAVKAAQAVTAKNIKAEGKPSDGGMVTGAHKATPETVSATKAQTGQPMDGSSASKTVMTEQANSAPKPPVTESLTPLPEMPKKPVVFSPSNPNKKWIKMVDEMEAIANSGSPDAAAKVQALASTIVANHHTAKKTKKYAADIIAALGGQKHIDAMPAASKKAAMDEGIATGTKIIKQVGSLTFSEEARVVKFKPEAVPEPPDFQNWKGDGQGLSSHDAYNKSNDATAQALYKAALENDLTALNKIDPGPSQHTKAYKKNLGVMLGEVGTVITKTKLESMSGGANDPSALAAEIGSAFPAKKHFDGTASKFAKFVVAGETDAGTAKYLYDSIPEVTTTQNQKLAAELLDKSVDTFTPAQRKAYARHVSGEYTQLNAQLRDGVPGDPKFEDALQNAKHIEAGAYELPEGLVLSRKFTIGTHKDWEKQVGKIISEPGVASTSILPTVWGGDQWVKLKIGKGVKGAYIGVANKSANKKGVGLGGEHELVLPRNTKWYVANVKKGGDDSFFKNATKNQTIIEILVLPNDEA